MKRLRLALTAALLAPPAVASESLTFSLETRAGLVEAPFVTPAFPTVSGFASVLTGTAAARLEPVGWVGLRVPVSFVGLDFPARAQVAEAALGNVELSWQRPLELRPSTRLLLLGGLLVPVAEHGSKAGLLNNRALALASALSAGQDGGLLTPGVTGLRLEVGLEHARPPFELRVTVAVPVLLRVSDASLPEAAETRPVGLLPSIEAEPTWRATAWLSASLRFGLISEPLRVQEPVVASARSKRLQLLVAPAVRARLGEHSTLGLEATVPVGGNLGGEAWSLALSGRVEF